MEKMGSCPRSLKLTELNLGPRSLAGLMFHPQFLLVRFGMPDMSIVKPVWVKHARRAGHEIGMPGMTDFDVSHYICI